MSEASKTIEGSHGPQLAGARLSWALKHIPNEAMAHPALQLSFAAESLVLTNVRISQS